jgi:hypothetical protein
MDPDVDPEELADPEARAEEPPPEPGEDEAEPPIDGSLIPAADVPLDAPDADWLDQQREPPVDDEDEAPR